MDNFDSVLNPFAGDVGINDNVIQKKDTIPESDLLLNDKYPIKRFKQFLEGDEKYLVIYGSSGVGKHQLVYTLCQNYDINVYNEVDNTEKIKNILTYKSAFCFQKKIYIFDNFTLVQYNIIISFLEKEKCCKVVFISPKDLSDDGLYLPRPSCTNFKKLAKKLKPNLENISMTALMEFVQKGDYDGNIRNFMLSLDFINVGKKTTLKKIGETNKQLVRDIKLSTENTLNLFIDPKYPTDFNNLIYTSMYTNNLIWENYIFTLNDIEYTKEITDNIVYGDIFKKYIYLHQHWDLNTYMGFHGTFVPGLYIKKSYNGYKTYKINNSTLDVGLFTNSMYYKQMDISYILSNIVCPDMDHNPNFKEYMVGMGIKDCVLSLRLLDKSFKFKDGYSKNKNKLRRLKNRLKKEWNQ